MAKDGVQIKINAEDVLKRFQQMNDFSKNFMPLWPTLIGEQNSSDSSTIRGGVKKRIESGTTVNGDKFFPLSAKYKKWKDKNYSSSHPILFREGTLYDSLVSTNEFSVVASSPLKLVYGTSVSYAAAMQFGYDHIPARPYMGLSSGQRKMMNLQIRKYLVEAYRVKGAKI